ncbi:MarR family winged helix-turn-helix transcriptional regulator [Lacticaseibacillus saniviri]
MTDALRTIGNISRALDAIANIEFKALGLTKGQYVYLARIVENPGIIQSRLAEMIRLDRTTVAHAAKKLESDGFITRRSDGTNKKNKGLFPTDKGLAAYPQIKAENDYSNTSALRGLSSLEQENLLQLLQQVSQNVTAEWLSVSAGEQRQY